MPKVDELDLITQTNAADIVAVTETWLTDAVPDSALNMTNFNLFRKDRTSLTKSCGGGVAVYIHSSHPARRMYDFERPGIESLWVTIRPHRLPRHTSIVLLVVVYHPPSSNAEETHTLLDHLQSSTDLFLTKHPDALVIITGDFNPNSTNLKACTISRLLGMSQLIKVKTRDTGVLDLCFVNKPKLFDKPKQLPKIGNSDHYTVLVEPVTNAQSKLTTGTPVIYRRQMKDSNIREFGQWITSKTWNDVFELEECGGKYDLFQKTLADAIDDFFPKKRCKTSNKDKPWVTSNLKILISQRQAAFSKYGQFSDEFKHLRNKVQYNIKTCKSTYYHNRVKHLKDGGNVSKWWKETKRLGSVSDATEWYHQLLCDTIPNLRQLTEKVNDFFVESDLGFSASIPTGQHK